MPSATMDGKKNFGRKVKEALSSFAFLHRRGMHVEKMHKNRGVSNETPPNCWLLR